MLSTGIAVGGGNVGLGDGEAVAVAEGFGVLLAVGLAELGWAEGLAVGGVLETVGLSGTTVGVALGVGDTLTGAGVLAAGLVLGAADNGGLALLP